MESFILLTTNSLGMLGCPESQSRMLYLASRLYALTVMISPWIAKIASTRRRQATPGLS